MKLNKVTNMLSKAGLKAKKYSPEIMVIGGCIGAVGSAVMACKATTKVGDILEESKETLEKVHNAKERLDNGDTIMANHDGEVSEYTMEDAKKDTGIVYIQTAVKLAKLYAPAVFLGTLSIAAIIGSHNILKKRNVALAAAYTAVDKGFKEYRNRVVDKFGEKVDQELRYGTKAEKVNVTVTDENGKEKTVKKTVDVVDENNISEYGILFNQNSKCYDRVHDYNLMFLKAQQQLANDMLVARGHLFLNEVYDMLGVPRTASGQVVGWVYNPENPVGDNYVEFIGLEKELYTRNPEGQLNQTIILDFNVDGYVLDLM